MTYPTTITRAWLEGHDACANQVEKFAAEWPEGAALTRTNLRRAVELDLDVEWLADHLLPAPARRAYNEACALAWRAYDEATAPALQAYDEARALALADALGLPEEEDA